MSRALVIGLAFLAATTPAPAGLRDADAASGRIERMNQAFLKHLASLSADQAVAVATIRDGWNQTYRNEAPEGFIPDALALLSPEYREALVALDEGRAADVQRILTPLRESADPYLRANAAYFQARAMVEQGRFEEADAYLGLLAAEREKIEEFTPYAPQLWFLKGFSEARNLRFDDAEKTLASIRERFADAPESVQIGVRQMLLEIERRERGTLDEVATVMNYVADRLRVTDTGERVKKRQDEVLELLDKLIKEAEDQEKSQSSGGGSRRSGPPRGGPPQKPAEESRAPEGPGEGPGDLHAAPKVQPGESWGKLPPTEREKILQSLRERFPSRYRQLVEQYYRSLAEQK